MKFLVAVCLLAAGVSAQYGDSGVVYPDGRLVQFTREEADNIAAIGESGVVMNDGTHIQFDQEMAFHHANIPAAPMPVPLMLEAQGPYGYSGIVYPDGNNVQFTQAQAGEIVLIGPSGVVRENGMNLQLTGDGLPARKKRSVLLEGPSGLVFEDGQLRHLPEGVDIVVISPSGAVLTNGDNVQFRTKRSPQGNFGESGIVYPDGTLVQFTPEEAGQIINIGPSGVIRENGDNIQLNMDGVPARKKRSVLLEGPSGLVFEDGQLRHLPEDADIAAIGPSGAVLTNGDNVQFRNKRAVNPNAEVGESGVITPGGRQIQLPHGVSVVLSGPSALLLSNGESVQYEF